MANADGHINQDIDKFRQASRELFNHYFRGEMGPEEWEFNAFKDVQALLFTKLVLERNKITGAQYGDRNAKIKVNLRPDFAPIMVNREKKSGYWDFPLKEVTREVHMSFMQFFDWDEFGCRDNQYVRVTIEAWPGHPEATDKQALIDAQYISYSLVP